MTRHLAIFFFISIIGSNKISHTRDKHVKNMWKHIKHTDKTTFRRQRKHTLSDHEIAKLSRAGATLLTYTTQDIHGVLLDATSVPVPELTDPLTVTPAMLTEGPGHLVPSGPVRVGTL